MSLGSISMKLDHEEKYLNTFSHVQHFELVFTEKDFDVLLDYCR